MQIMKFAVLSVLLVSLVAVAGESEKNMEIKVVKVGHGDDVEINWSGKVVDLEGLAVGEQRVLADESGEPLTVTRTEEGLSFLVDGETIALPDHGEHDVHMMHGGPRAMKMHRDDGITIISGEPLDDSVKETIRSVLVSAGRDDAVRFVDGSGKSKRVKVVRKHVETVEN